MQNYDVTSLLKTLQDLLCKHQISGGGDPEAMGIHAFSKGHSTMVWYVWGGMYYGKVVHIGWFKSASWPRKLEAGGVGVLDCVPIKY